MPQCGNYNNRSAKSLLSRLKFGYPVANLLSFIFSIIQAHIPQIQSLKNKISINYRQFIVVAISFLFIANNAIGQITLVCPTDVTVNCASEVPAPAANYNAFITLPGASVSSACGGIISITHNDIVSNVFCTNQFTISRTYMAYDDCGSQTESCVQTIIVNDDTPPVFLDCPPTVIVGTPDDIPVPVTVSYTDCNGTNTIDPNFAPPNIYWEEIYGLENQPGYCPDSIYRLYVAMDACGNTDTCTQKIYVINGSTCPTCEDDVQYWPVDLTADPPFEVIILNADRFGLCCDFTAPSRCVAFNLMMNPDAVSLSVDIRQGNSPWQSASVNAGEWRVNCEPAEFTGNVICLSGDDFFTITHCKPGSNSKDYRFRSVPGAIAWGPPITRVDCGVELGVENITSPVWNSIYPGSPGQYNSYLSCTDCFFPIFTPTLPIPDPPMVTYQVCGDLIDNFCQEGGDCDEVTIAIFPNITLGCDGETFYYCGDGLPEQWLVPIDVSPPAIYQIEITNPNGITNTFVNQNNFFYTPPDNTSGAYAVFIKDLEHNYGCDSGYFSFNMQFQNCITCPETDTICYNESITLNNLSDFTALGGLLDYPCDVNASTFMVNSVSDNLSCPETITYFVSLTDICGNYAACDFNLVKGDFEAPTWVTAAGSLDRSVECGNITELDLAQALFPVAIDNCDPDVTDLDKISGPFVPDPDCPTAGTYSNTWTVTDSCGNVSEEYTQIITVEPAPQAQFIAVAPITISCDEATNYGSDSLLFTNSGLTGCLIEGKVLGVITGTFDECGGTLTQDWTFTDECNRTSTQSQTITVLPAPQAQFESVAPMSITCDEASAYIPDTLMFTNYGLGGCLIEGEVPGIINGTYDECGGTIIQTWTYTDNCNRTSTQSQTITVLPAPQAAFLPVDSVYLSCDQATTFSPVSLGYTNNGLGGCLIEGDAMGVISGSFDECGGELIQSWSFTDNCGRTCTQTQIISVEQSPQAEFSVVDSLTISCDEATTLSPSLLLYSNYGLGGCLIEGQAMGLITGSYDECGGELTQSWSFTDNCGRTSTQSQIITVEQASEAEFDPVVPLTISCDEATVFTPSHFIFSNEGLGGCLIQGQVPGILSGTYDECGGELIQTWTFTDNCNRTITQTQTITVEPAPQAQFISVSPLTISCDEATDFVPYNLLYSNGGLGGCLIEGQVMGVITGTYNECGGELTQSWTYTDDCSRTSTQFQVITVEPAPQAQFIGVNPLTITCDEATAIAPSNLLYTNSGLGGCLIEGEVMGVMDGTFDECGGQLIQTWTFTDSCDRTSTQTQVITVEPAPQAQFPAVNPISLTCDEASTYVPDTLIFTNNGLGGCLIEGPAVGVITGTFDECGGTLTQTWTFTDNCNRTSTQTQTITVEQAVQAEFENVDSLFISCDEATTFSPSLLGYTNGGLSGCLIEGQEMGVISGTYDECGGELIQTWTFTDDCGRTSTQVQIISVEQSPQAEFSSVDSLFISCDVATAFSPNLLLYSNYSLGGCLIEGQEMGVISGSYDECGGELTQTWTFTDNCGRTSTQVQIISVEQSPQAEFSSVDSLFISCDEANTFDPSNLLYTNNGLGGCLIEGQVMGVITGTYDECGGELVQSWEFTDDCDRTCTQEQIITVEPTPQAQFNSVNPLTISCDEATVFAPANLLYTNSGLGGCLIEGEVMGVITGTYDECGGQLIQTWTFTDDCDRTSTQEQIITIEPSPQAQFNSVNPLTISLR